MTPIIEPGDDSRAAERVVALIAKFAHRFDPVDRITFYSGIAAGSPPDHDRAGGSDACRRL